MWTVCITSVSHVLTVNRYGGRLAKVNEKSQCFKGWETLVNYNINGKITSEGWCIFQDDIEDDAQEVGIWKYYTSQGIKIVNKSLEY